LAVASESSTVTDEREADTDEPADHGLGDPSEPGEVPKPGQSDDPSDPDPVELGMALLAHCEDPELSVAEAVDRLETITTDPRVTREILETAEADGIIEREETTIEPVGGNYVNFESQVVVREGEFTCRRCGAEISTGHFVNFDAGELGPFGSSCIRKVTGRE
jgi:hypothetical protein